MFILGLFAAVVVVIAAGSFMLYEYYSIVNAEDWPDVGTLYQHSAQFETTRILDRNGNLLYEIIDPHAGRRTYVPLDEISPYLVAATLATEDKEFYSHPGFDPMGIVRAFWQNFSSGETVSGASTITQQLTRALLLSPEERGQRSYMRKVREALLAMEVTRRYTKDEILELYLNEIYYGNMAYGVEAAAQTYFGTSARNLTLAQAAFLAGLPQLPAIYDPYTNREAALERQETVLLLMFQMSQEQGCIYVGNNPQPICIDPGEAALAAQELDDYEFKSPEIQIRYPHWVTYVRAQLEAMYDPAVIYRSGFDVYTTLDPGLQDAAQKAVSQQVAALADKHVTNGALVMLRKLIPEKLYVMGGPAAAMSGILAKAFKIPETVPHEYAIANAIGAALTRSTMEIELFADTEKKTLVIPELEIVEEIPYQYSLEDAVSRGKTSLAAYLQHYDHQDIDENEI